MKFKFMKISQFYLPIMVCLGFILTSCSGVDKSDASYNRDPFENTNRQFHAFNDRVDTLILEPVAYGYNKAIPQNAKIAVANHVFWAGLPNTALNSGLQGKWENTALSSLHFSVNALTLGLINLVSEEEPPVSQDFGKTLSVYDIPEGPYVVLPILGGKTSRHAFGQVANMIVNPYSALEEKKAISQAVSMQPVLSTISWRAANFDIVNDIKYNSLDGYVRARSAYYQNRFGEMPSLSVQPSEADALFDDLDFEK